MKISDDTDLRWLFNYSDGEMSGMRSNFGSFIERMQLGTQVSDGSPPTSDPYTDAMVNASRRRTRILRVLAKVPRVHVLTLQKYFTRGPDTDERRLAFGSLSGLIARTVDIADQPAVTVAIMHAQTALELADNAYSKAKEVQRGTPTRLAAMAMEEVPRG